MQSTALQFVPYQDEYLTVAAQAIREILTTPPLDETLSLSDIVSQLQSDAGRSGFNGLMILHDEVIVGGAWWFAMTGSDLQERWRPRFIPKEDVPNPPGIGAYIPNIGVAPSVRSRGIGAKLLKLTLDAINPDYEWVATASYAAIPAAQAMLHTQGFTTLPLTSTQSTRRVAMLKPLR